MTKPIKEYDDNGNCIHYRDSDGYEYWREYDDNGRYIYYKDSKGFEKRNEYDENGKLVKKTVTTS